MKESGILFSLTHSGSRSVPYTHNGRRVKRADIITKLSIIIIKKNAPAILNI